MRGVVVLESEKDQWKQLSIDYMSEESDDTDDNQAVVVHPPQWRSRR